MGPTSEARPSEKQNEPVPATAAAPVAAPAAAGPPAAPAPAKVDAKRVASTVDALEAELGARFYTNDKKVTEALRGKSPDEIAAIRQQYKDKTGKDMDELVQKHVSGKDLEEANALLKGDKARAASLGLQDAIKPGDVNKAKMNAILEDVNGIKDEKERQKVLEQMKADYAKATGSSLDEMIKAGTNKLLTSDKNNHEMQAALALAGGNKDKAEAVKLDEKLKSGVLGVGKDTAGVQAALEGKDPAEQARIAAAYKAHTGKDLKAAVGDELGGADKEAATAKIEANEAATIVGSKDATPEQKAAAQELLARKDADASAAKIEASMGTITDKKALMKSLEMKTVGDDGKPLPPDELAKEQAKHKAMVAAYDAKYGEAAGGKNLQDRLATELSGLDAEKAQALARDGKCSDELSLKVAMKAGVFVDREGIKKALKNPDGSEKTAEQIAELKQKYGKDFDKDIVDAAGGASKDALEIDQLLRGKPTSAEEELERARERHQHERGGGASQAVMDLVSNRGEKLDAQQARLEESYKKLAAKEARGEPVTEADKREFDKVKDYQGRDAKMYGDAKNNVAEAAGTAAGVLVGAGATVLTGGAAAPALAAALSAGAGTAATMATKAVIKGGDYEGKELVVDAATGAASALTGGAAKAGVVARTLNRAAGVKPTAGVPYAFQSGNIPQELAKGATTGAVQSAATEGTRSTVEQIADGQNVTRALYDSSGKALKAAGTGGLNSAVAGAITYGLPRAGAAPVNRAEEVARATRMGALGGAAGAAATTTVDLAVNGSQGASGLEILGKYGGAVAGGTLTGAADGRATKRNEHRAADRETTQAANRPLTEPEKSALRTAREQTDAADASPRPAAAEKPRVDRELLDRVNRSLKDQRVPRPAAEAEAPAAARNVEHGPEEQGRRRTLSPEERLRMSPEELLRTDAGINDKTVDAARGALGKHSSTPEQTSALVQTNDVQAQNIREGATVRKFIPGNKLGAYAAGVDADPATGQARQINALFGSRGLANNSDGLAPAKVVGHFGLDYENGRRGQFTDSAGDRSSPDRRVLAQALKERGGLYFVDQTANRQDARNLKVPVRQEIFDAAQRESSNPGRYTLRNPTGDADPFTGTGGTASRNLRDENGRPYTSQNQELLGDATPIRRGAELKFRDNGGAQPDEVVARAQGPSIGGREVFSPTLNVYNPDGSVRKTVRQGSRVGFEVNPQASAEQQQRFNRERIEAMARELAVLR